MQVMDLFREIDTSGDGLVSRGGRPGSVVARASRKVPVVEALGLRWRHVRAEHDSACEQQGKPCLREHFAGEGAGQKRAADTPES